MLYWAPVVRTVCVQGSVFAPRQLLASLSADFCWQVPKQTWQRLQLEVTTIMRIFFLGGGGLGSTQPHCTLPYLKVQYCALPLQLTLFVLRSGFLSLTCQTAQPVLLPQLVAKGTADARMVIQHVSGRCLNTVRRFCETAHDCFAGHRRSMDCVLHLSPSVCVGAIPPSVVVFLPGFIPAGLNVDKWRWFALDELINSVRVKICTATHTPLTVWALSVCRSLCQLATCHLSYH